MIEGIKTGRYPRLADAEARLTALNSEEPFADSAAGRLEFFECIAAAASLCPEGLDQPCDKGTVRDRLVQVRACVFFI